jgi:ABC-type spermidine/putrescine transport system permease subunit II
MAAEMLLLLPGHWSGRSRRALAYAAFTGAVTSHIMMACGLYALVLTADLNTGAWMTVYFHMFFFLSAGLRCLEALLGQGDYAN